MHETDACVSVSFNRQNSVCYGDGVNEACLCRVLRKYKSWLEGILLNIISIL